MITALLIAVLLAVVALLATRRLIGLIFLIRLLFHIVIFVSFPVVALVARFLLFTGPLRFWRLLAFPVRIARLTSFITPRRLLSVLRLPCALTGPR